ncbi:glycine betaine ABC transporter substrate-binding protein [Bacillus shivajii]|uniref:glycine betaine ABC transporter substrate-binding protein n=1 Tax=Bacillus shivajii TaxID=1983719 RepID=UPI001CFC06B2|nr:glycine betaine ABC transporter substrate-binding protein [Bacillus shivajii]UCZ52107.1 glycine betaine ABC transporter substrate-binding protein [Bacillus shivajii]
MFKKNMFLTVFTAIALLLAACGDDATDGEVGETDSSGDKGEIEIGLNNWAENIAISNMWKIILEEEGYDVTLTMSEKAPIWTGIASGGIDLSLEVWLPTTDEPFYEDHGDDLDMHEVWFEGTGLGLAVPEYFDIDSIDELNDRADEFDNRIVGIDAGASLTRITEEALEEYDLDLDFVVSSEPAMITELDTAYQEGEPVVVTLWNPHWAFSDFDIKYLEDPKGVYGEPEDIYYMSRLGFEDEYPEVIEWLNNWMMDDETLGELMSYINELGEEEGAEKWIDENRDMINEWLGKE